MYGWQAKLPIQFNTGHTAVEEHNVDDVIDSDNTGWSCRGT